MKIKDIKPNPFKKRINGGKLNPEIVDKLKESIEHGTLPKRFVMRKGNELVFGHHRLEAFKQVYGDSFEVDVDWVDYTDEQMLIDMVRENLTQRDTDFHDEESSVVLAREWLEGHPNTWCPPVGQHGGNRAEHPGSREIAKFLSRQGKVISKSKVTEILNIHENLDEDIKKDVKKHRGNEKKEVTIKHAQALSTLPKEDQKPVLKALKRSREQLGWKHDRLVREYKKASDKVKDMVKSGEIDIDDIKLYEKADKPIKIQPTSEKQVREVIKDMMKIGKDVEFIMLNAYLTEQQKAKFRILVKAWAKEFIPKVLKWLEE